MNERLLGIYLNDHLAAATAGVALARRVVAENRANAAGEVVTALLPELEEDRRLVVRVLAALGLRRDRVKQTAAWVGERLGRTKLNGHLLRYSPLSRLLELEALCAGTGARLGMLRVLERLQGEERRLDAFDFAFHVARAERQARQLERLRAAAAVLAFGERRVLEAEEDAGTPVAH